MFNLFGNKQIKSHKDYINFVRTYIKLIDNEFNFIESEFKKGNDISANLPLLISLINTIDALRGQGLFFNKFREKLKGNNFFQSELYSYENKYQLKLSNFILDVFEKYNLKENTYFQQMYDIYLNKGLKDFSINNTKKLKVLMISDRKPYESIKSILGNNNIDLIITLGDLDFHDIEFLGKINNVPKIGIYGNHCDGKYLEDLGIINLHLKTFTFKGIKFGGFEGSIKYKKSNYGKMYNQEEAYNLLGKLEEVDVLLTHNPPFGIHDNNEDNAHIGFNAINKYIKENRPYYIFHGHTHVKNQKTIIGNTRIYSVYGSEIKTIFFI